MSASSRLALLTFAAAVITSCRDRAKGASPDAAVDPSPARASSASARAFEGRGLSPGADASAPGVASAAGESGRCPAGMVLVAGGSFTMGAADPAKDTREEEFWNLVDRAKLSTDERPAHRAVVKDFCIGQTEVTTAAYADCVTKDLCARPVSVDGGGACNFGVPGRERHPINCVSWEQAKTYCARQGGTLPSEVEWEYAARGSDRRWYPWGNADASVGPTRYCGSDRERKTTCQVGSYPEGKSPFGLDDMAGNVAEWTANTVCTYPKDNCGNPDDERVYRGSAFFADSVRSRVTFRAHAPADSASEEIGFRCAARPKN